jgi:hypothetical protein
LAVAVAVSGGKLTNGGFILQLPFPEASEHVRLMLPLNPLADVMVIDPCVFELPAFTVGKGIGSERQKSGTPLLKGRTNSQIPRPYVEARKSF